MRPRILRFALQQQQPSLQKVMLNKQASILSHLNYITSTGSHICECNGTGLVRWFCGIKRNKDTLFLLTFYFILFCFVTFSVCFPFS